MGTSFPLLEAAKQERAKKSATPELDALKKARGVGQPTAGGQAFPELQAALSQRGDASSTAPEAEAPPERTKDWLLSKRGLTDIRHGIAAGFAGIGTAAGMGAEFVGRIAEDPNIEKFGTGLRAVGNKYEDLIREQMSPTGREPKSFGQKVVMGTAESLPGLVAMGLTSVPASAGLRAAGVAEKIGAAAIKRGMSTKAATRLSRFAVEGVPAGVNEGLFSGVQNAAQTGRTIRETPFEKLQGQPAFEAAYAATDPTLDPGARAEQARKAIAEQAESEVAKRTALSTGGIGILTGGGVLGRLASKTRRGAVSEVLGDTALESVQEFAQSGPEQLIQNVATRDFVDKGQNLMDGVLEAALVGGASGGLLGGIGGAFHVATTPREELNDAQVEQDRKRGVAVLTALESTAATPEQKAGLAEMRDSLSKADAEDVPAMVGIIVESLKNVPRQNAPASQAQPAQPQAQAAQPVATEAPVVEQSDAGYLDQLAREEAYPASAAPATTPEEDMALAEQVAAEDPQMWKEYMQAAEGDPVKAAQLYRADAAQPIVEQPAPAQPAPSLAKTALENPDAGAAIIDEINRRGTAAGVVAEAKGGQPAATTIAEPAATTITEGRAPSTIPKAAEDRQTTEQQKPDKRPHPLRMSKTELAAELTAAGVTKGPTGKLVKNMDKPTMARMVKDVRKQQKETANAGQNEIQSTRNQTPSGAAVVLDQSKREESSEVETSVQPAGNRTATEEQDGAQVGDVANPPEDRNQAWRKSMMERGIEKRQDVSADAVDSYGIKLPAGYVRKGDRYVFQSLEKTGVAQSKPENAVAQPAVATDEPDRERLSLVGTRDDVELAFAMGVRLYALEEQNEELSPITSLEMSRNFTPDSIYFERPEDTPAPALPANKPKPVGEIKAAPITRDVLPNFRKQHPKARDPRLIDKFSKKEGVTWDELMRVPEIPKTLEDKGRADLAVDTGHEEKLPDGTKKYVQDKQTAVIPKDSPLVEAGIVQPGTYSRDVLHRAIVRYFTMTGIPRESGGRQAYMSAGGGGAGKTTILKDLFNLDPDDRANGFVTINADEVKTLIPEFGEIVALGDGRAARLVHEESSYLSKQILDEALAMGSDLIYDATLSDYAKAKRLAERMKDGGYNTVIVAVTIDPYEAIIRAFMRAAKRGRYVPVKDLLEAHKGFNLAAQQYSELADGFVLIDNTHDDAVVLQVKSEDSVEKLPDFVYDVLRERGTLNENARTPEEIFGDRLPAPTPASGGTGEAGVSERGSPSQSGEGTGREATDGREGESRDGGLAGERGAGVESTPAPAAATAKASDLANVPDDAFEKLIDDVVVEENAVPPTPAEATKIKVKKTRAKLAKPKKGAVTLVAESPGSFMQQFQDGDVVEVTDKKTGKTYRGALTKKQENRFLIGDSGLMHNDRWAQKNGMRVVLQGKSPDVASTDDVKSVKRGRKQGVTQLGATPAIISSYTVTMKDGNVVIVDATSPEEARVEAVAAQKRTAESAKPARVATTEADLASILKEDGRVRVGAKTYTLLDKGDLGFIVQITDHYTGDTYTKGFPMDPVGRDGAIDRAVNEAKYFLPERAPEVSDEKAAVRTAAEITESLKKNGIKGADEAMKALGNIFGGPGRVNMLIPVPDEETYARAKPHLIASYQAFTAAGKDLKEFVQHLVKTFGAGIKPYLMRFKQDLLDLEKGVYSETKETSNERRPIQNTEQPLGGVAEGTGRGTARSEGAGPDTLGTASTEVLPEGEGRGEPEPVSGSSSAGQSGNDAGADQAGDEAVRSVGDDPGRPDTPAGRAVTASPKGNDRGANYRITDTDDIGAGGEVTKYNQNIEAIRILRRMEKGKRRATPEEQAKLVKYVGWGGMPKVFNRTFDTAYDYEQEQASGETSRWSYYGGSQRREAFQAVKDDPWYKRYKEIRELLSEEEFERARTSVLNAHYTSAPVIRGMYKALARLGFRGGRMIEPAAGIGHFMGLQPDYDTATDWTAVELDTMTGAIAKALYPEADVRVQGFETTAVPNNWYDVALSNVPFGGYKLSDAAYDEHNFFIHDYFFAKSLDKVRPGGVVAFITSKGTLDKIDKGLIGFMDTHQGQFIGAIRLPNTAFKKNANTEVVTDIIFVKKVEAGTPVDNSAIRENAKITVSGSEFAVNKYFVDHPEMVLGTWSNEGKMRRGQGEELTVAPGEEELSAAMERAAALLPEGAYEERGGAKQGTRSPAEPEMQIAPDAVKEGNLGVDDAGRPVEKIGGLWRPMTVRSPKAAVEIIKDMIPVRTAMRKVLTVSMKPGPEGETALEAAMKDLNKTYDRFVKRHGPMNGKIAKPIVVEDVDGPNLLALEDYNPDTKKSAKMPIFSRRVIAPPAPVTRAGTVEDAARISLHESAALDVTRIAQLLNVDEKEAERQLVAKNLAFVNPETHRYEDSGEYLSGYVRAKLKAAEEAAKVDPSFQRNVEALQKVQPADKPVEEITVQLGAPWVGVEDYVDFLRSLIGGSNDSWQIQHNTINGAWQISYIGSKSSDGIKRGAAATREWGTDDYPAHRLMQTLMNQQSPRVSMPDPKDAERDILDPVATELAEQRAEAMKRRFVEWVWGDTERRARLHRVFNDRFNDTADRVHDGNGLTFPGMSEVWKERMAEPERAFRLSGIARAILSGGNTLFAWAVGAGKTSAVASVAMEVRRMKLARKPLIAVPNSMIEQWAREFQEIYPNAKILRGDQRSLSKARRQEFLARVATGDWDAVIVPHSVFSKIGMSAAYQQKYINEEIARVERAILEADREKRAGKNKAKSDTRIVKQLESTKQKLQARLQKAVAEQNKDKNLRFDELGVDYLFVDEAHNFKGVPIITKLRTPGIQQRESQKAMDLEMKTRYITGLHQGRRGVVFASGTPISNSISEMYVMMRYLNRAALERKGIDSFDDWVNMFGNVVRDTEVAPTGRGFRVKDRFARFNNVGEMGQIWKQFADVVLSSDLKIKRPGHKGGGIRAIEGKASKWTNDYIDSLVDRASRLYKDKVDPRVDNMLKITNEGRMVATDPRLLDAKQPDAPDSKVNKAVANVLAEYKESSATKGAQLVFLDMGIPKGAKAKIMEDAAGLEAPENVDAEEGTEEDTDKAAEAFLAGATDFDLYADIKKKLIAGGMKPAEVAFIHDAKDDNQRAELFAKVRSGQVRVLIGNTPKMGEGINVQKNLVAIHHIDVPWKPAWLEQRNGRIFRSGNINEQVNEYRYATGGSFDAYMWQTIERKAGFIGQALKANRDSRVIEDIDTVALTAQEMKAIASGDPAVRELITQQHELSKLLRKRAAAEADGERRRSAINTLKHRLDREKILVEDATKDEAAYQQAKAQDDKPALVTQDGRRIDDDAEIVRMIARAAGIAKDDSSFRSREVILGTYFGLKVGVDMPTVGFGPRLVIHRGSDDIVQWVIDILQRPEYSPIRSLSGMAHQMPKIKTDTIAQVKFTEKQIAEFEASGSSAFSEDAKIAELEANVGRLMAQMEPENDRATARAADTLAAEEDAGESMEAPVQPAAEGEEPAIDEESTAPTEGEDIKTPMRTFTRAAINRHFSITRAETAFKNVFGQDAFDMVQEALAGKENKWGAAVNKRPSFDKTEDYGKMLRDLTQQAVDIAPGNKFSLPFTDVAEARRYINNWTFEKGNYSSEVEEVLERIRLKTEADKELYEKAMARKAAGDPTFSASKGERGVVLIEDAERHAAPLLKRIKTPVRFIETLDDLSKEDRAKVDAALAKQGLQAPPRGINLDGTLYVVASQLQAADEALEVVFHEVAENGFNAIRDEDVDEVLDDIFKGDVGRRNLVYQQAFNKVRKNYPGISNPNDFRTRVGRAQFLREVLSHVAEKRAVMPSIWTRAVNAVRTWLAKLFRGTRLERAFGDFRDNAIESLVDRMLAAGARPAMAGVTAFSGKRGVIRDERVNPVVNLITPQAAADIRAYVQEKPEQWGQEFGSIRLQRAGTRTLKRQVIDVETNEPIPAGTPVIELTVDFQGESNFGGKGIKRYLRAGAGTGNADSPDIRFSASLNDESLPGSREAELIQELERIRGSLANRAATTGFTFGKVEEKARAETRAAKVKADFLARLAATRTKGTETKRAAVKDATFAGYVAGKRKGRQEGQAEAMREGIKKAGIAVKEARADAVDTLQDIKTQISDAINENLPVSERGRLVTALANAKTQDDVYKALVRIDEYAEEWQKKVLISSIGRELKKIGNAKNIAIDYVKQVHALMLPFVTKSPNPATIQKMQALKDFIDRKEAAGEDVEVPASVLAKLRMLTATPLADVPNQQLADLLAEMRTLSELGKTKLRARKHLDKMRKDRDKADILAGTTAPINDQDLIRGEIGEGVGLVDGFRNMYRQAEDKAKHLWLYLQPMDVVFDMLDGMKGFEGAFHRIFKARTDVAFGKSLAETRIMEDAYTAKMQEHKIGARELERIAVVAFNEQESGREKLINNNGLTEAQIDAVKLEPREQAFLDWMRTTMDEEFPAIKRVMREVYNQDVKKVNAYFPMQTDWSLTESEFIDGFMMDDTGKLVKTDEWLKKNPGKGFTIKRKGAGRQALKLNAGDVFLKHMRDVKYMVNMSPTSKYLGELAMTDAVREAAGDFGQRIIREYVDTLARRGSMPEGSFMRGLDLLRRNIGAATMGLKATSIAIQPTALLNGAGLIGRWAFKGASDMASSKEWRQFVQKHMPEVANRVGDDPSYVEFGGGWTMRKIREAGYWPLAKLDMLTASAVGIGAYQKYAHEHGLDIDFDKPDPKAIAYAERAVRRTQSSPYFKDVPLMVSRGKGFGSRSLAKAVLQFQNFTMNEFSLLTHEGLRAAKKNGKPMQAFNIWLWSVMSTMAIVGMRDGILALRNALSGAEDDEDRDAFLKRVLMEKLNVIPFMSQFMSVAAYDREPVPVADAISTAAQSIGRFAKSESPTAKAGAVISGLGAAGKLAGIPGTVQAEQLAKDQLRSIRQDEAAGGERISRPQAAPPGAVIPARPAAYRAFQRRLEANRERAGSRR